MHINLGYLLSTTKNNLSGSVYPMTASIKDSHGFRTGTTKHSVTIAKHQSVL